MRLFSEGSRENDWVADAAFCREADAAAVAVFSAGAPFPPEQAASARELTAARATIFLGVVHTAFLHLAPENVVPLI